MLVTIVVPIYNMEAFLHRCISGILNQTYQNIEIVLVDDGSIDGSLSLCKKYAQEYPNKISVIHKENGGLSSARNAGIAVAKGEYIIFPDPDDWVEKDYIEKLIEIQRKYQADLVCAGHYIDYDTHSIPVNENSVFMEMTGEEAQRALLLPPSMNGFAWNKLYHMDIIKKNGLRFLDDVGITEDLDFACRYLNYCKKVCFDPTVRVYHYYQRAGAATHSGFSRKKLESVHTYEKIVSSYNVRNEIVRAAEAEICNTAINLCWMYKNEKCNDIESWKKIREYLWKYMGEYLKSNQYNRGRKVQALLAYFSPNLYVKLKRKVQKD